MVIEETDIHFRYSGGAANSDPLLSLGGTKSSVSYDSDVSNSIWDNVSGTEKTTGDVEYRCWYLHNNSSSTLVATVIWISSQTDSTGDVIDIGLDPIGKNGTATTIANESTAPAGVTFSRPSSFNAGLILGDLAAGQHYAIWERRTVTAGAPTKIDNRGAIMVRGEIPD
jgi:hypothetical protein